MLANRKVAAKFIVRAEIHSNLIGLCNRMCAERRKFQPQLLLLALVAILHLFFPPTCTLKLHCLQKQRHPEEQLLSYAFAHLPTAMRLQSKSKMCIAASARHQETSKEFQDALLFVSESGCYADGTHRWGWDCATSYYMVRASMGENGLH